ncbi:hypothetical protein GCM10028819_14120 [Spirosoma humi]
MNRFFVILLGLLVRVTMVQAQSALAVNAVTHSSESANTAATPHRPKAIEAPFYVKIYGFYGLLTPGVQINSSSAILQSGASQPFKTTTKGLGAGPRAGLGIGLIVNDFINIGLDAEAMFGSPIKIDYAFEDGLGKTTTSSVTTLNVVSLIPNITFKALSRPTYYIYNRLGLVGGMVLDYKTVISYLDQPKSGVSRTTSGTTSQYTKNSLALGYQAALGVQFRLSQAIRGFVEIVAYNQSFKPQRLEVTTPATATKAATTLVTDYNDQGSVVAAKATTPGKDLRFNVPLNSVGVGAGLVFRF